MARVTVEDCIDKVDSPYELVLVAKERATQLNSGIEPTLDRDNDKNTVIALREIAEENIKVPDLTESAVYKLRKHVEQIDDGLALQHITERAEIIAGLLHRIGELIAAVEQRADFQRVHSLNAEKMLCRQHRSLALLQCRDSVCGFVIGLYVHENQLIGQTPMAGPVLFSRVTQITAPKALADKVTTITIHEFGTPWLTYGTTELSQLSDYMTTRGQPMW